MTSRRVASLCFRQAEAVAITALQAQWPGFQGYEPLEPGGVCYVVPRQEPVWGGLFAVAGKEAGE